MTTRERRIWAAGVLDAKLKVKATSRDGVLTGFTMHVNTQSRTVAVELAKALSGWWTLRAHPKEGYVWTAAASDQYDVVTRVVGYMFNLRLVKKLQIVLDFRTTITAGTKPHSAGLVKYRTDLLERWNHEDARAIS